jgi:hypothetical protein
MILVGRALTMRLQPWLLPLSGEIIWRKNLAGQANRPGASFFVWLVIGRKT